MFGAHHSTGTKPEKNKKLKHNLFWYCRKRSNFPDFVTWILGSRMTTCGLISKYICNVKKQLNSNWAVIWLTPSFPDPYRLMWMRVWQQLQMEKQTVIHVFRHCSGTCVEVWYLQNYFEQLQEGLVTKTSHLLIKVG